MHSPSLLIALAIAALLSIAGSHRPGSFAALAATTSTSSPHISTSQATCMTDGGPQPLSVDISPPLDSGVHVDDIQTYYSIAGGPLTPYDRVASRGVVDWTGWTSSELQYLIDGSACPAGSNFRLSISVRGIPSNTISLRSVPPPKTRPIILSIRPASKPMNDATCTVGISATNLDYTPTTRVTLDGQEMNAARYDPLGYGGTWYLPKAACTKAGHYQLVVWNRVGSSNPASFDVLGLPVVTAISPAPLSITGSNAVSHGSSGFVPVAAHRAGSTVAIEQAVGAPTFVVKAHDIDDGVRLQIGDGDIPIDRKVLTYGAQQVAATLPSWALRCGHQSYSVRLVTSVGASNQMNLDVDGKPCAAPLPAGSLHTTPPR